MKCATGKFELTPLRRVTPPDRPIVYGIVQAGENLPQGVPYIRSTDVGGRLDPSKLFKTAAEIASKYSRSIVADGDIVFSLRGNIGETSIVPETLAGANLTQGTARIGVSSSYNNRFVEYALKEHSVRRTILTAAKGSTFKEITLEDLRNIEILAPDIGQQEKIANILSDWDHALHTLSHSIAAKEKQKRGLMQKMLTGKARLRGFEKKRWRETPLSEILERVTRLNSVGSDLVLTISGQEGLIDQRTYFNRQVASKDLSRYYLLKRGEFAYNKSTSKGFPLGAIKRLENHSSGVVSSLYICFRLAVKTVSSDYLTHCFDFGLLNEELRTIAQVGARAHGLLNVTPDDFFSLTLRLPDFDEQEAIANILNACSKEIKVLRNLHSEFEQQMKGLMQNLLTGKVRVKVTKGEV